MHLGYVQESYFLTLQKHGQQVFDFIVKVIQTRILLFFRVVVKLLYVPVLKRDWTLIQDELKPNFQSTI